MARLTRLRIDRFRNVKPGTDLRFGPTFNVLLGKNATGKSTLLDLIAAATNDLQGMPLDDEGFDLTCWLEEGETQIELRAQRSPAPSDAASARPGEEREFDDLWRIVLRAHGVETDVFEVAGARGVWSLSDGSQVPFELRAPFTSGRPIFRSIAVALNPSKRTAAIERLLNALSVVRGDLARFDEAVATLDAITASSFEVTRHGAGTTGYFDRWLPWDFQRLTRSSESPDLLVIPFEQLNSISAIPRLLGFVSAELRPRVTQRSQNGERVTTTYQGFDCLFRRADGSQISHKLLSFGQKRLFAFLWYLAVREQSPVVADELLNGLHHEWIEICLERLRERQSFLATQHPFLLDHIPVESAAAVRTTFIRCTLEIGPDGREIMAWRNFDEEEADRFFVAYQTGIQQVSEVLRSEGLW